MADNKPTLAERIRRTGNDALYKTERPLMADTRQLTLVKKGHYYLFRYTPGDEASLIQTLIDKATDPACPLDWFDAAVLSHQMGHRMGSEMQTLLKAKHGASGNVKKAADAT